MEVENIKKEVVEILRQQLQLLSEKSKDKDISAKELYNITAEMTNVAEAIYHAISD